MDGGPPAPPDTPTASDSDREATGFEFTFQSYLTGTARVGSTANLSDDMADDESLTESVFNYPQENGRTYHAFRAGSYYFPNDHIEVERLAAQHLLIKRLLDGRNYLAPWSKEVPPQTVLDVATGTGDWAIEMGDEFPTAQIIGIDLSPIQPTLVPPNVSFFVEDATEDWHESNVDYIHSRITMGCWTDIHTELVAKAFRKLRPGGWFEAQEIMDCPTSDDATFTENSAFCVWYKDMAAASERAQRPLVSHTTLKDIFEKAGFVDVHERVFKLPINGWPENPELKHIGELWLENLESGLQAFSYGLMHRVLGKTKEQIEVSLVDVRKGLADTSVHAYTKFYVVWGRKPESQT